MRATNYFKVWKPADEKKDGREGREAFVFFSGSGDSAARAFGEVMRIAREEKIPSDSLSVFRRVDGVPRGVPQIGEVMP